MSFALKTTPFPHQAEIWDRTRETPSFALLWEQGTGKTKPTIDTAAWLHHRGLIGGLLVVAPNGVHENWVLDELPAHCPGRYVAHAWSTRRSGTKAHAREVEELIGANRVLRVLAMSYDALMTTAGAAAAKRFLQASPCLYVLDESQRIKTAGRKRTIRAIASGRYAPYRRILSGTPVTNKPFDIYSQLRFLDETFWPRNGFASYEAFKTYFGIWEQRVNGATGQRFNQVVAFRNLSRLRDILATISSRIEKDQVLDLPPKLYQKRYFDLTPEQERVYAQIRDQLFAELASGMKSTAPLMVTRLLRFQQITCGYLPGDPENVRQALGTEAVPMHRFAKNPRLAAFLDLVEDIEGSVLVFCRFQADVEQVCTALGADAVRHDGSTDSEDRARARERFQAGEVRFLVGTPDTMGAGFTLHKARVVVYYSSSYNLEHRLQSEDRAHRIGQEHPVTYVDIVARGTVDERIVTALREKRNVAAEVVGDRIREWI